MSYEDDHADHVGIARANERLKASGLANRIERREERNKLFEVIEHHKAQAEKFKRERDEEREECKDARTVAKIENQLRLEAERERDEARERVAELEKELALRAEYASEYRMLCTEVTRLRREVKLLEGGE